MISNTIHIYQQKWKTNKSDVNNFKKENYKQGSDENISFRSIFYSHIFE